jgi:hypothetical protein
LSKIFLETAEETKNNDNQIDPGVYSASNRYEYQKHKNKVSGE